MIPMVIMYLVMTKYLDQISIRKKRSYLGSQFQGSVDHGSKITEAGT